MKRLTVLLLTVALLTMTAVPALAAQSASAEPSGETSSGELLIVPGTYTAEDGSVLTVNEDGTAAYETVVSGRINARPISGRLTFTGTLEIDGFSFDRVKFYILDLTDIAASLGYTDASLWEGQAEDLYRAALTAMEETP